jgi:xanthine dehydrogenase small subunit
MRDHVILWVNGRRREIRGGDVFLTTSDYLRRRLGLVGTKIVCAEGDCGACTVLVGRPEGDGVRWLPIDSCIRFIFQLDGCHLVTVEGLARDGELAPVQQTMIDCHGSQCGFCTPGFVMTLAAVCHAGNCHAEPSASGVNGATTDWRHELAGNLCRCTGYISIIEAAERASTDSGWLADRYPAATWADEARRLAADSLDIRSPDGDGDAVAGRRLFMPTTLAEALAIRAAHPQARVVAGATDLGVQWNKGLLDVAAWLDLGRVADLARITVERDGDGAMLVAGGTCSWTDHLAACRAHCPALVPVLEVFGGPQIRHVGTLGGNIVTGSPIGDSLPMLFATDAELELASVRGRRTVPITAFYTGYRRTVLAPDELLVGVRMPLPSSTELVRCYKVSRRRDLDISTFTAAIRIALSGDTIASAAIAYGGVGPTVLRLSATEASLVGRPFTEATFRAAGEVAHGEITPISDVRGSRDYRLTLARNLLVKFFHEHEHEHGHAQEHAAAPA